jgi:pimeloyl-ACP methyl ester carboxylesterase/DNA-binding winged helix-turn-helix (wHTH) protein
MRGTVNGLFTFEDFELDPTRFELRRAGETVHVEPQVFEVLLHLVAHHDRVVTKHELLDHVWGGRFVGESALTSRVKAARRAVSDDGSAQRLIRTVHGRGYRFIGPVVERTPPTPPAVDQTVDYCWSADGHRIAWAASGDGPPLVKIANWMTHLGFDGQTPVWRHWLAGLSQRRRLIRYDELGCGMSDWDATDYSVDAWVQHLEAVVDAAGLDRFPLLGISQGGAVGIEFALRHPERVSHLIVCGAYGRGRLRRATSDRERREAAIDIELARLGWGRDDDSFMQVFTAQFLPDGSRDQWEAHNELQRRTTRPENAVRFLQAFATIDVLDAAAQLTCPTLILHAADDRRVPHTCAEELAKTIPRSRLVTLDSRNHILTATEPAWPQFLDEVESFLGQS